jgi:hypothetical protein
VGDVVSGDGEILDVDPQAGLLSLKGAADGGIESVAEMTQQVSVVERWPQHSADAWPDVGAGEGREDCVSSDLKAEREGEDCRGKGVPRAIVLRVQPESPVRRWIRA